MTKRYAFFKNDLPELRTSGKTMVAIVELEEGSTVGEVIDAAVFKTGSSELAAYVAKQLK